MTPWAETYRQRVTTADEAVRAVRAGDHVWVHAGCNNPEELVRAMVARASELRGVEVAHLMTFGSAAYADPRYSNSFRHRALFIGANVREAVNDGRAARIRCAAAGARRQSLRAPDAKPRSRVGAGVALG